jgi:hypothetical protein
MEKISCLQLTFPNRSMCLCFALCGSTDPYREVGSDTPIWETYIVTDSWHWNGHR